MNCNDVIAKLGLVPLPEEGGFYKETYRSQRKVQSESLGTKSECTAIYYLITKESFSALHKVDQDEIFHFYAGSPVEMFQILEDGSSKTIILGNNFFENQHPQVVVPYGVWQGTKLQNPDKNSWALLGCTVSPGFEFKNFHIKTRYELINEYPQHEANIKRFTNP